MCIGICSCTSHPNMNRTLYCTIILLCFVCCVTCFQETRIVGDKLNLKETNVTLREWPYVSWLYGPPCRKNDLKLVPIQTSDVKQAISEIESISKLFIKQLEDLSLKIGLSVSVVYDQQVLLSEGYGSINVNSNTPPSDTTVFNIGSVTKIFTSLAFYHSVEQKYVSLTDPVTKFFNSQNPPEFSIHNPYSSEGSDAVTLHSLASQSSGLPREAFCGAYPITKQCENNTYAAQENLSKLSQFGLLYSPFTNSHYSNLGLALLGRCLERVWNEEYETYMENTVFPSIGMTTNTGFSYTQQVIDNMATGYAVETLSNGSYVQIPDTNYNTKPMAWSAPAGGAFSTRQDFNNFFMWAFGSHSNSSFLSQSFLDEYFAPGMLMANGIELFGQGTFETFYANKYWTLTKGGLTASMGTSITFVPQLKLAVSVMMNIDSGIDSDDLTAKINQIMVPALENALQKAQSASPLPSNYQTFLGSYGYSSPIITISDSSSNNGVLSGMISFIGNVNFIWDQNQDYGQYTAFRYSATAALSSCMSNAELGTMAIAYIKMLNGTPHATLADENGSLYDIPMMKN